MIVFEFELKQSGVLPGSLPDIYIPALHFIHVLLLILVTTFLRVPFLPVSALAERHIVCCLIRVCKPSVDLVTAISDCSVKEESGLTVSQVTKTNCAVVYCT